MSSIKLQLPFDGIWFVMNGGDTKDVNHHHGNKAQHYAIDFTVIDDEGRSYKDDGKRNEDYFNFGKDVLSPADGVVVESVTGVVDNLPGFGNYLAAAGNHVVIQHSENEFSFIAHLKFDSTVVKVGQKVKAGEKIGQCGNTGTSFAPHLHYHLQDSRVLVSYTCTYDSGDSTKGTFPTIGDLTEECGGIKPFFQNVVVNGEKMESHSLVRGNLVGNITG